MMPSRRTSLAVFVVLGCFAGPSAQAAPPFEDLYGTWRGKGVVRAKPDSELERAACRITASAGSNPGLMQISGRCANANQSARFDLTIERLGGGRVVATFASPALKNPVRYAGSEQGTAMRFRTRDPFRWNGQTFTGTLDMRFSGSDQLFLSETLTDTDGGSSRKIFELTYKKQ